MVCGRKIIITNLWPQNVNIKTHTFKEPKNNIILNSLHEKKFIELSFWNPYDNSNLTLALKKRKNKFKIKIISLGSF